MMARKRVPKISKFAPLPQKEVILFDLDGTLCDTSADLGNALNQILISQNQSTLPLSQIRTWIHGGSRTLLEGGLGITPSDPHYEEVRQQFLDYYEQHLNDETALFPGVAAVLEQIEAHQLRWGVVTNKPEYLARQLLQKLDLISRCCCLVGGDTTHQRKPLPGPLLHACGQAGVHPERCVYVGDTEGDILAARASGMSSIAVTYGYHPADSDPTRWRASFVVHQADAISSLLFPNFLYY